MQKRSSYVFTTNGDRFRCCNQMSVKLGILTSSQGKDATSDLLNKQENYYSNMLNTINQLSTTMNSFKASILVSLRKL